MTRKLLSFSASVLCITLLAWTAAGQEPKGAGEQIKEKAREAVTAVKKGVNAAEEGIRQEYERARAGIQNMSVSSRVYSRLHWDKALHTSKIDVKVQNEGTVTLTGTVADSKAKAKAVELAVDTVGVVRVIDLLSLPASTTAPAKAAAAK
ncbi:MAG TPA: BON domain-containing protein [Isosphaeraceae bacterium]|jgi:osmotically-inducible protein OsmY|nr:BON domain-containing protein [Isosphaeraceae bacterium]